MANMFKCIVYTFDSLTQLALFHICGGILDKLEWASLKVGISHFSKCLFQDLLDMVICQ